jgi:hypothetical protein
MAWGDDETGAGIDGTLDEDVDVGWGDRADGKKAFVVAGWGGLAASDSGEHRRAHLRTCRRQASRTGTSGTTRTPSRQAIGMTASSSTPSQQAATSAGPAASDNAAPSGGRPGPDGLAFYVPPSPLVAGAAGQVIWSRQLTGAAALPGAAENLLVL